MKKKLFVLGFVENKEDNNELICNINDYLIKIYIDDTNIRDSKIDYGNKIKIHNNVICSLKKDENLVQLECVIRLLKKGYKPENIELEKTYKLGHREKGRLDICVNKKGKAWLLIECKTFGDEYESEKMRVLHDGGQIFSYFTQDRLSEVIAIYASKVDNNVISYISEQIFTDNLSKEGDNTSIFNSWNKEFINNGIFDELSGTYETKRINLRKENLIDLNRKTGESLYNEFAEILRKYVISDKSNAFNIIFNLFVCKIYDEDIKSDLEELDFQIKIGDDSWTVLKRLSTLYKESIKKYLSLSMDEKYFSTDLKITLKEFQFIDVYNDETFNLNYKILSEVIILLQKFRIKYSSRHQFLGDFFENLLSSGVKQEAGQYFTPIPLVRFILKAIPIEEVINRKIIAKEPYILPHIIDYACGAGHFLTEAIEEINSKFNIIDLKKLSGQQKRFFEGTKNNYLWAKDYIYGIEKDQRLAKTTKIAMFLNGDGDASIINGDGLDDFYYSNVYTGLLKSEKPESALRTFDIIVSNPPFGVEGFSNTIKNKETNFYLSKFLTKKSDEIECFFIERSLQLLKPNGYGALILPLSFFERDDIYINARKLLLIYSQIVSMVELSNKAFIVTNTNTSIFFFRKRECSEIKNAINNIIKSTKDNEKKDSLKNVLDDLDKTYSNKTINNILLSNKYIYEIIKELNNDSKCYLAYSGEKKNQEYFMGYRYSTQRNKEGIKQLKKSLMYNVENTNDLKLDTYIKNSFVNDFSLEVSQELEKHLISYNFNDLLLTDDSLHIKKPSSILAKHTIKIESISPIGDIIDNFDSKQTKLINLINSGDVLKINGLNYDKDQDEVPQETKIKVLTASNMNLATGKIIFGNKMIHLREDFDVDDIVNIG